MLYNKEFLLELDKQKNKIIYGRIAALNFQESPIETIEGRVTQGSINIDGASAVRRTCSLTMIAQDFDYHDYYWGMNTKFRLEIGVENTINKNYPDIIWFKQGTYLITNFNTSNSTNNFTISLQGKDKMCLLNGEVGGNFMATTYLDTIEEETKGGIWKKRKIPIKEIIRELVHVHGEEPYHNIIINDLDDLGLELLEYRYDKPMYLYRETESNTYTNVTLDGKKQIMVEGEEKPKKLNDLSHEELDMLVTSFEGTQEPKPIKFVGGPDQEYYIAKIEYGQTAGYRTTDLIYPGDLIANIGESVTQPLDKIKNMLGEFEYFYDLDGRFVFQKKQAFKNTIWTPAENTHEKEEYAESLALASGYSYTFSEGELITQFNNNPNLLNLRNDFSIWGERISLGQKLPIHLRYAIDKKPIRYYSIEVDEQDKQVIAYNAKYGVEVKGQSSKKYETNNWREIIYQMAKDYYQYNFLDDFELRIIAANPDYPTGRTGYEQYYTDIIGFWRKLYNPHIDEEIAIIKNAIMELTENKNNAEIFKQQYADEKEIAKSNLDKYPNNLEYKKQYQEALDKYNGQQQILEATEEELKNQEKEEENLKKERELYYYGKDDEHKYWNKNIYEHPELLDFWFDFLDVEGELDQFNVKNVGARTKPVNDTNIKSIYFRETPNVVFGEDTQGKNGSSYKYIQANDSQMTSMFSISSQGLSAKDKLDELIYNHSYCIESTTITTIPIYYLEPNTRICVYDNKTNLNGDYIISKITLPLTYNGLMTITATKAAESLW